MVQLHLLLSVLVTWYWPTITRSIVKVRVRDTVRVSKVRFRVSRVKFSATFGIACHY